MPYFTKEQLQEARRADLYEFLTENHAEDFVIEGVSIHPRDNRSLSIKRGYCGYMDFNGGETGNSVDYLVRHMGYSINEAVLALLGENSNIQAINGQVKQVKEPSADIPPSFPEAADSYSNVYAYLAGRGISSKTVRMLVEKGLLYQSKEHNNCVFINDEKDWGELRGTYTYGEKGFHGMVTGSRTGGYWAFQSGPGARKVYVCEAAIDAISLYELQRRSGTTEPALYASIGGVAKQNAIDRICKSYDEVILAVDNDSAGQSCRDRNPQLPFILPQRKDWNEDLVRRILNRHR